jgi:hypothetical protein
MRSLIITIVAFAVIIAFAFRADEAKTAQESDIIRPKLENLVHMPKIIKWSDWETGADVYWLREARKRFKDPVVVLVHGGYDSDKRNWCAVPDAPRQKITMSAVAWVLHNLYPDQDIVLVACNEFGYDLNVPRVWYAKTLVWQTPDADVQPNRPHEVEVNKGNVGTIWEFVTMPAVSVK